MAIFLAALVFAAFLANVVAGAYFHAPFVGDVGEMLLLWAASVAFVVAILKREAAARHRQANGK